MTDGSETDTTDDDGTVDRRSLLKYGGTGALTAGLAGCQSPQNPLPGGSIRVREEESNVEEGGSEEQPLAGETITVGALAPMSLPVGTSTWKAARQAKEKLNANGGIMGAEIEVKLGDTEVSPAVAAQEHRRLIINEGCDFTLGNFLGSGLLQMMPSIANQEKIHLTSGAADPRPGQLVSKTNGELTGDSAEEEYERFKYHFRAGPIHLLDLADAMLEMIEQKKEELGWERAALLSENIGELTPYHERLDANLSDVIDVRFTERPGGVSDWSPIYNEIENNNCDITVAGLVLSGTTAVNQWAQQEREFEFGGIHVPAQAYDYWDATDGNIEHVFTMNAFTPQTKNTENTQDFVQDYKERWDGAVPLYTGALTYEAMALIEATVKLVVEEEGLETLPEADTMIPYMEDHTYQATDGILGGTILKEFQFTPPDAEYAHEPVWTSIEDSGVPVFQQWQFDPEVREDHGTMHSFFPPQNKSADYTTPDWFEG